MPPLCSSQSSDETVLFDCLVALHTDVPGCGAVSMLLRTTLDVQPLFRQHTLCCNEIGCTKLQECQGTFLAGRTAKLRYLCEFSSGPCFRLGHTPTDGAEGWRNSRKHLGCLELRRSDIVESAAMALVVPPHDKATVDAACI